MRALTPTLLFGVLLGCGGPAPVQPLPDPDEVALERPGGEPLEETVRGAIAGEEFTAIDVRMRVVEEEGRARVDLFFSDRPIERCGLPIVRSERLVWLRVSGGSALEVETLARTEEEQPFELHYEIPRGVPGEIAGDAAGLRAEHRGLATLAIDLVAPDRIEGRLRACFADVERSCVGGRFVARPCLSRIDGRMAREPPGLIDEALEPPSAAPAAELPAPELPSSVEPSPEASSTDTPSTEAPSTEEAGGGGTP